MSENSKDNAIKDKARDGDRETTKYTLLDDIEFVVSSVCSLVIMGAASYFFMKHS
jgi:hypothetical protein